MKSNYKSLKINSIIVLLMLFFHQIVFCNNYTFIEKSISRKNDVLVENEASDKEKELQDLFEFYTERADTLSMVKVLVRLSELNTKNRDYVIAYENLSKAQQLVNRTNNIWQQADIHRRFVMLLYLYEIKKERVYHMEQYLLKRKFLVKKGAQEENILVSPYLNYVVFHSSRKEFTIAQKYLDSCIKISKRLNFNNFRKRYIDVEQAQLLLSEKKYDSVLYYLNRAKKHIEVANESYIVAIHEYMGDYYNDLKKIDSASFHYEKSLYHIDAFGKHLNKKSLVQEKLANLLYDSKNYDRAFSLLKDSKNIKDSLLKYRIRKSGFFYKIKETYKSKIDDQNKVINEQVLALNNNEVRIRNLQRTLFVFVLIVIILFFSIYILRQKKVFKERQKLQARKHVEDSNKNKIALDYKNRELTAYTLQLIEKEAFIEDLKDSIVTYAPKDKKLHQLLKSKASTRDNLWEEFNNRFTEVNKSFYQNLQREFPELSKTELKYCALVKLNFSAKEMTQLLNITVNSVNVSRYRIRKKMKLNRDENLHKFLNKF